MKFSNYLTQITGVSIYPLISLVIFVLFFGGVIWYVYRTSSETIQEIERLPLDDEDEVSMDDEAVLLDNEDEQPKT